MKNIVIMLLCLLLPSISNGQNNKRPTSYNYTRGVEAIQKNNVEEALEYFNKEIAENPENGYAYSWITVVRNYREEYGEALTAANKAIKYLPPKDKEYIAFALSSRAKTFHALNQDEEALRDYAHAIKARPDNSNFYEDRAQLLFELQRYDLADNDYHKMISLDQGGVMGYMGLGRNANVRKQYNEAIKQYDYVIKLAPSYSSGYSFRAESYMQIKKFDLAIDDIISALGIDGDNKAFHLMQMMVDSAFLQLTTKLKLQAMSNPTNDYWTYCLGVTYEWKGHYQKAIDYYKKSYEKDFSPITANRISNCYDELGDYDQAIKYVDMAIEKDSTKNDFLLDKANILDNAGKTKDAISLMDKYLINEPKLFFGYYRRGWMKDHIGDIEGALEDYTMAITLEPTYAYTYLNRGVLYRLQKQMDLAKKDFESVLKLDTVPNNNNTAQYALYYLGRKEEAIAFQNKILSLNDNGNYYDAACLYSIMGDKELSTSYLRKALEHGFRRFAHIKRDRDLNNIRDYPAYLKLMKEYEDIYQKELAAHTDSTQQFVEQVTSVPFTKEDGVCKVKCEVNNLPLHFVFDTGASDVSISNVEATFMLKNDYLRPTDVIGRQSYMNANGEISEGTVLNLRNVNFAGLVLSNIKASVVNNQEAPLLLGQSVLGKLGKIEIDNERSVLKITSFKKK